MTEGLSPGLHPLGAAGGRDGWIYVPDGVTEPAPLLVTLHGAGGEARRSIRPFVEHADAEDVVLLAVDSRGATWDIVTGAFGPDVEFVDRALQRVFDRITVDPDRIAIAGYSDGASYALSLGLSNGELFDAVVAFSPGSALHENSPQQPRVFVAHGTSDRVLPIDRTSRRVVPRLEDQGYDVRYEEFDGGHEVPERIREAAMDWLLGGW